MRVQQLDEALAAGARMLLLDNMDLPTLREAGYDKLVAANWFGIVVPAKVPESVVAKLSSALDAALASDVEALAWVPGTSSPSPAPRPCVPARRVSGLRAAGPTRREALAST